MNQEIVIIDIQIYNVHYVTRASLDVVLLCSARPQQLYMTTLPVQSEAGTVQGTGHRVKLQGFDGANTDQGCG